MFTNWKQKIRPKLMRYYEAIGEKMAKIRNQLKLVMKIKMQEKIDDLQMSDKAKQRILSKWLQVKNKDGVQIFNNLINMQRENQKFMLKVRASFYCTICDYENHRYIDVPNKIIRIADATCADIATATINYSYFLNVEAGQYLENLSTVLAVFSASDNEKPLKIKHYKKILKSVKSCAAAVQNGSGNLKVCRNFCHFFNLNANSPVVEGYQIFFNEIINNNAKFLTSYGNFKKGEKERLLQGDQPSKKEQLIQKILKEVNGPPERNLKDKKKSKEPESNDNFTYQNYTDQDLHSKVDPYDESLVDKNFDEFVLNDMFNRQTTYEQDRQEAYVQFIVNKLKLFDTEFDYNNAEDDEIFKQNTSIIVDLDNFATKITGHGINIEKHIETCNIDKPLRDLVSHIKENSHIKITYEKLDPNLVAMVNEVDDRVIRPFHRDSFMKFKNMSL